MTNKQLKAGDLVVFRSRIDCQKAVSAEYDNDGDIKSLYVTDHEKSTLLKWEERANDPVIELHVSFDDVLAGVFGVHGELQFNYEHRYIDFDVEQVDNPLRGLTWKSKLSVEREEADLPYGAGYFLDWEMSEDEVKSIVRTMLDSVVNNFTLI